MNLNNNPNCTQNADVSEANFHNLFFVPLLNLVDELTNCGY